MFGIGAEESRNGRSLGLRTIVNETALDGSFEMEFHEIVRTPFPRSHPPARAQQRRLAEGSSQARRQPL